MHILAIETSCDETAAAVVEDGKTIRSNIIASQVEIHARYGGIVPEVASRQHMLTIVPVMEQALREANMNLGEMDALAVTRGPGLAGSLIVGVNFAKALALTNHLPITGINHLEGHIYANWLGTTKPELPCLCLIVSGGHSDMILMEDHGKFRKLGNTRDDAAGEAFDKGARILGLPYPGGPSIQKATHGVATSLTLPRAWLKESDDFSFSGVKTALLHLVEGKGPVDYTWIKEAAAAFQDAIVEVLVTKTIQAAIRLNVKQILLAGGVASNSALRARFLADSSIPVLIPPPVLCTDNAAMIACCAYYHRATGDGNGDDLDVIPGLALG
ncbi:MAG: tRNA (adenosine(37)-N6)-threonylcarbamoyltransferase complex transferase subunit TsaD [Dehalococcoidia bacterium]|nr:tRNA (adenosine(37)-N6)-threonylcarbamoyltransferase complex transferase subunit TsaD [Dehalococcoidia bacterium]MDD5494018.1 tRNA (adenosine(37)-N6)-threonylcarbamoyltransferase complex transferase subunit TsaD [Dehalococcoidia bacterium]